LPTDRLCVSFTAIFSGMVIRFNRDREYEPRTFHGATPDPIQPGPGRNGALPRE